MGAVQRYQELVEGRGWADVGKTVCSACLFDEALIAAVRGSNGTAPCDYCGATPIAPEASAPVELVLELIVDGLRTEYEDPIEQVPYSSADGGYQMALLDTEDILSNHEVTEKYPLLLDLISAIEQQEWVQRDPYAASPTDALKWGWAAFRRYVKHRRRYTFLARDDSTAFGAGEIAMHGVPAALAEAVATAGQIRVMPVGTTWWRVRPHPEEEAYRAATEIGSPPDIVAKDNRMTAKGIGAFYGASTALGARAEVAGYAGNDSSGTLAQFQLLRDITVVDLTSAATVPSLFDAEHRHRRAAISFMREFIADVAEVAAPSDSQNLDYIPTQVVSEFFRYELSGNAGPVTGILWRSSKDSAVENCVVFASNEQMADSDSVRPDSLMLLVPGTVSRLKAPL